MSPTAIPARITIDFRDAVLPSRSWILGVDETVPARVELIAFDAPPLNGPVPETPPRRRTSSTSSPFTRSAPHAHPTAMVADCACPEFCERDHANE
jgi:hypothetical protein